MSEQRGTGNHQPGITPAFSGRGALNEAIQREHWELAALCLLVGVTRAAESLPPDAVEALLEILAEGPEPRRTPRTGRREGGCREPRA